MAKTILITGATDGIGLETAKVLVAQEHHVLLHGRSASKLDAVKQQLSTGGSGAAIDSYIADLSDFDAVAALAESISADHQKLDVIINNAGVLKLPDPIGADGLDKRFVVNTLAPYLLTKSLLPLMDGAGRVINLSSAAQSPVDTNAMLGKVRLDDMEAYAQSKLAITIWTRELAAALPNGPAIIAVNPGSLLASKMVKEGFGVAGNDLSVGAGILVSAALSDQFDGASGKYFDNDSGRFAAPHSDALNAEKSRKVMETILALLADRLS